MQELSAKQYHIVENSLDELEINTYFCKSVICNHVDGRIFVDDINNPKSFYIIHNYGMTLLFGNSENEKFNYDMLKYLSNKSNERIKDEWLQIAPENWKDVLKPLVNSAKAQLYTRQNFKFNKDKYKELDFDKNKYHVIETNKGMFNEIQGSVIPKYFWKDADLFQSIGKGFSVIENGKIASTAYSSYVHGKILEIGIETLEEFRGKGYAIAVCAALIDYCLKNNLEPVWSCRFENTGSLNLAKKLGFIPTIQLPYYHIPV